MEELEQFKRTKLASVAFSGDIAVPQRFIGLMSGTSMDGIDAVVASFNNGSLQLHHAASYDYPTELRQQLKTAANTRSTRTSIISKHWTAWRASAFGMRRCVCLRNRGPLPAR